MVVDEVDDASGDICLDRRSIAQWRGCFSSLYQCTCLNTADLNLRSVVLSRSAELNVRSNDFWAIFGLRESREA